MGLHGIAIFLLKEMFLQLLGIHFGRFYVISRCLDWCLLGKWIERSRGLARGLFCRSFDHIVSFSDCSWYRIHFYMLLGCFRFKLNSLLMSNVNFISRFLMCKYVRLKSNMIHHLNKFTRGFKVVYVLDDIGFVVESSVFLEFSTPSRCKNANIILISSVFRAYLYLVNAMLIFVQCPVERMILLRAFSFINGVSCRFDCLFGQEMNFVWQKKNIDCWI